MTAKQFNAAIAKLGLSQLGAARMLGISGRQARRYAAGEQDVGPGYAKLLKLALAGKLTIEDIEGA